MVAVQSGKYQKHEEKEYHGNEEFLSLDYTLFSMLHFMERTMLENFLEGNKISGFENEDQSYS